MSQYVTRGELEDYQAALIASFDRHTHAVCIDSDLADRLASEPDLAARQELLRKANAEVMRRWNADALLLGAKFGIPGEALQGFRPN